MSFATTVAAVAFRVGLSHRRSGSVRAARFIATTDHDNVGTDNAVRKLQPCYNDLLLISGGEMTTDEAHANIFGTTKYVDRQLNEKSMPDMGEPTWRPPDLQKRTENSRSLMDKPLTLQW
jgi:hypothetical protein